MDRGFTATWLTNAVDGIDHAVSDEEFARTSARAHGRFEGVCEATVWPSSLATPPSGRCTTCTDRLASEMPGVNEQRRRPRMGLLRTYAQFLGL